MRVLPFLVRTEIPVVASVVGAGSLISIPEARIMAFSAGATLDEPSAAVLQGSRLVKAPNFL